METKKAYKSFQYKTAVAWNSARRGVASAEGKAEIQVGSGPEFRGEAGVWTPEDMLVGALNTCMMLTFLALAGSKHIEPVAYESSAEGLLENVEGKYRITEVTVSPAVTLKTQADLDIARELMQEKVEANCFITNSISGKVKLDPQFKIAS